jgi:hypothetical protein
MHSCETLVATCKPLLRHNPDGRNRYPHGRENLKSQTRTWHLNSEHFNGYQIMEDVMGRACGGNKKCIQSFGEKILTNIWEDNIKIDLKIYNVQVWARFNCSYLQ